MSNGLDVAIVGWILLGALGGFWAGLFRSAARLLGYFVAFWGAAHYYHQLSTMVDTRIGLARVISNYLSRQLPLPAQVWGTPVGGVSLEQLAQGTPLYAPNSSWIVSRLQQEIGRVDAAGVGNFGPALQTGIGRLVVDAIAFLFLFVVIQLLVDWLGRLLQHTVGRLPFFGGLNRLGGLVFGAAQHALFAALFLWLFGPFIALLPYPGVVAAAEHSSLLPILVTSGKLLFPSRLL